MCPVSRLCFSLGTPGCGFLSTHLFSMVLSTITQYLEPAFPQLYTTGFRDWVRLTRTAPRPLPPPLAPSSMFAERGWGTNCVRLETEGLQPPSRRRGSGGFIGIRDWIPAVHHGCAAARAAGGDSSGATMKHGWKRMVSRR